MCRKLIFGGVILLTSLLSLSAQADWSQSSLLFLTFEPDAASYGRGGTGVAIVAGPEAAFYNPAAIGLIKDYSVTGSYLPYIDYSDLAFWHLSGGYSFGDDGILALSANYFDLGRSERTDEMGNSLGEYFSYDLAVGITYAL